LKKRLSKLGTNVKELQDVVDELFEEDEEIAELYLTKKPPKDMENVESILENALEQIEDLAYKIAELNENIDDSQEILSLKMDHLRTTMVKFDLIFTAATGLLAFMTVVTGLYGMNIVNNLETSYDAFWTIIFFLAGSFLLGLLVFLLWLRKKQII
jgi:Mg2+ and Co2+ transporter CorA